jgi:hypothetical protein
MAVSAVDFDPNAVGILEMDSGSPRPFRVDSGSFGPVRAEVFQESLDSVHLFHRIRFKREMVQPGPALSDAPAAMFPEGEHGLALPAMEAYLKGNCRDSSITRNPSTS